MGVELLTERYKDQIAGVLSCYDRIIIQGTVPGWSYAGGMTDYFYKHQIRIFDYAKWAEPLREKLRTNTARIAAENGIEIEFVRSRKSFRKEDRIKEILNKRGDQPGNVLSTLAPVVSIPAAVLLQWPQCSGSPDEPTQYRIPCIGQRLWLDRGLRAGPAIGRRVPGRDVASETGWVRRSLLSSGEAVSI